QPYLGCCLEAVLVRPHWRRYETGEPRSGRIDPPRQIARMPGLARYRLGRVRKLDAAASGAMAQIDFLMTNSEEAAMLTGRQDDRAAAENLLEQGPEAVLVKRGACG